MWRNDIVDGLVFKASGSEIFIGIEKPFLEIEERLKSEFAAAKNLLFDTDCRITVCAENLNAYAQSVILNEVLRRVGEDAIVQFLPDVPKLEEIPGESIFVHGPVRSGAEISSNGGILVLGDVNSGAELNARGSIVVMGSLRGNAHAGIDGDDSAVIIAMDFNPTQIRIGSIISRPLEGENKKNQGIEIAFTKNDSIYVDNFSPKKYNKN